MQEPGFDMMVNRMLAEAMRLCQTGYFDQAKALYARLVELAPERPEPFLNCGEIAWAEGQYEDALAWFSRARALRPDLPPALTGLGNALLALGRPQEALEVFGNLGRINPKDAMAARGTGEAFSQLGRMAEARQALERATALAPDVAGHHYALAQIARFENGDPRLVPMEALARKMAALPPPAQCDLHFALAKAYDDLGRHQQAFTHWRTGNAIKRRYSGYNEAMYLGILRKLAEAFPAEVIAARQGQGDLSEVPVFVVGMPRSGTSLIEQILASHPSVAGAGESMQLHRLLGEGLAGADFPAQFAQTGSDALGVMGARYVAYMQAKAPEALRIVDKLPANFMLCGLIHCILPRAKIIHVKRDPLDTCFSCYANLFSQDIDYAYDLGELGRYYRAYETLMAHWQAVLPAGAILDVSYEALVEDFEAQARRIVDYCGLEWDTACLSFHRTERVVHTLSTAQVRQPLYRTAIGRAAPYASWLEPLRLALRR